MTSSSRAWLYGKLLVTLLAQSASVATFPPRATYSRCGEQCSPSREFSFGLHQIQQAIEPDLSLEQTLYSRNQIAQALAEWSRKRLLQLAKWHAP